MKLIRGNPGKRKINREEPQHAALDPEVPEEIAGVPIAREEWERSIVPAIKVGHISSADRVMAIAHCSLYAQWREQMTLAATHPEIIAVGPNNHPMPNPARGMANKSLLLLRQVDSELGFTPSSRSRVKVDKSKTGRIMSPVEAFRQRKHRATG